MKLAVLFVCLFGAAFAQTDNLVELATKLGANTLVTLVKDAGLAGTLSTGGPFTVFGPTDAAFAKLPKEVLNKLMNDKKLLADVLMYHVNSGKVFSSQLKNELLDPSLLMVDGKAVDIRINIYPNSKVTADGSPIVLADQNATNGVIHVLDRVMFPIPVKSIPAEVTDQKRFSTLLTAVKAANLVDTLSGGPFTLFAPTDEAFAKVPAAVLNKLLANATALADVLTYHVVSGTVFSAGLTNGEQPKTVEGKTLDVKISSDGVMINSANVIEADLAVSNGVIHVIDAVLLPPSFSARTIY